LAGANRDRFARSGDEFEDPDGRRCRTPLKTHPVVDPNRSHPHGLLGLLAPSGTPTGIIEQIAEATRVTVAHPGFQEITASGVMAAPEEPCDSAVASTAAA